MLKVNLQFFSDEEAHFDLDAEIAAFENEWKDDEPETEEVEADEETNDESVETEEGTEDQDVPEEPEATDEQKDETEPKFQDEKQNRAFAEMRRQLEAEKKYADVVRKIAEQNGMDPDKLLEQYQEQQLQKQAEEQKVPVDVLKRLQTLEQENNQIKQQSMAEKFNAQVEQTKDKFGLDENDIKGVFDYYKENNIPPSTPFEQVYKIANFDTLVEKQVKEAQQKELAEKKKRQTTTAIPNGDSASPNTDEITDDYVDKMLAKFDIRI